MKFRFFIFLFSIVLTFSVQATTPSSYQLSVTTNKWVYGNRDSFLNGVVQRTVLEQLDNIYKKTPSHYDFHYSKETNSLTVFVHCSLDFYSVVDDKLVKKYQFQNKGYTCGSNLFLRDGNYYLLGGRGFWTNHLDLLKFDTLAGSWEFTQIKNQVIDYFPLGVFHTEKGITALFGEYTNPRLPRLEKESHGFFLNWKQNEWQPIKIETRGFNFSEIITSNPSYFIETQDYGLFISDTELPNLGWVVWVLIEKESGKLFLYEGPKNFDAIDSPYREVIENKFFYFDYHEGSNTEGKERIIDLEEVRKHSKEIGQITYSKPPLQKENIRKLYLTPFLLAGFLPLLAGLIAWWYVNRQKKKLSSFKKKLSVSIEDEENENLLNNLLPHNGKKLSTEEFDQILGIHKISNFDSKRIKRARLIKEINLRYKEKTEICLITRIKNSEDKRFVLYKIDFG